MKNAQRYTRLAEIRAESLRIGKEYATLQKAPYTRKVDNQLGSIQKQYQKLVKEATGLIFNLR